MSKICTHCKFEILGYPVINSEGSFHRECTPEYISWIAENSPEWKKAGGYYRSWRLSLGVSLKAAAKGIGVASSTLSRFEGGEPITRAKLLSCAYGYFLESQENELLEDLQGRMADIRSMKLVRAHEKAKKAKAL